MNHLLIFATTLLGTTTKKTSSSSSTFLIFIVIVVAAVYFLFLRPNQQRAKKQRSENSAISVGDRVVSIGGIVGTIVEMQNDRVVLMTGGSDADGQDVQPTRLVLLRSAIARKAPEPVNSTGLQENEDEDEDEHDPDESGGSDGDHPTEGDAGA